jgi:hypothetical protein
MRLDDAEFVAADARDGVAAPDHAGEPLGDLPDQLVAGGVAIGVVDRLEAIEVDQQHRQALAGPAEMGEFLVQPEVEGAPVRQQRQLVLPGQALDLAFAERDLLGRAAQPLHDEGEDAAEEKANARQRPDELAQHRVARPLGRPAQPGADAAVGRGDRAPRQRIGRHLADDADVGDPVAVRQFGEHGRGDAAVADDLERPQQLHERALARRDIHHHHADGVEAVMGHRPGRHARSAAHVGEPAQGRRRLRATRQSGAEMLQPVIADLARRAVALDASEDDAGGGDDIGSVEFEEAVAEAHQRGLHRRQRIGSREGRLQVTGGGEALEAQLAQANLALDGGIDPVALALGLEAVGVAGDREHDGDGGGDHHREGAAQRRDRTLQHPGGCVGVGQFPDGRRRHQRSRGGQVEPNLRRDILISR